MKEELIEEREGADGEHYASMLLYRHDIQEGREQARVVGVSCFGDVYLCTLY